MAKGYGVGLFFRCLSRFRVKHLDAVQAQLELGSQQVDAGLVLACDTLVECAGRIVGKPEGEDGARQMLHLLSGKEHRVYTEQLQNFYEDVTMFPSVELVSTVTPRESLALCEEALRRTGE